MHTRAREQERSNGLRTLAGVRSLSPGVHCSIIYIYIVYIIYYIVSTVHTLVAVCTEYKYYCCEIVFFTFVFFSRHDNIIYDGDNEACFTRLFRELLLLLFIIVKMSSFRPTTHNIISQKSRTHNPFPNVVRKEYNV